MIEIGDVGAVRSAADAIRLELYGPGGIDFIDRGGPGGALTVAIGVAARADGTFVVAVRFCGPRSRGVVERNPGLMDRLDGLARDVAQMPLSDLDVGYLVNLSPAACAHVGVSRTNVSGVWVSGTGCCLVRSGASEQLLTCRHVAVGHPHGKVGDPVAITGVAGTTGTVAVIHPYPAPGTTGFDAALVDLQPTATTGTLSALGIAVPGAAADPAISAAGSVWKCGAKTGHTTGSITAFNLSPLPVDLTAVGGPWIQIDDGVEVRTGQAGLDFALPGDSGSLIVDASDDGVGMVVACDSADPDPAGPPTIALPLAGILTALSVSLA